MANGFGRRGAFARNFGGGMGFGFRGSSPPWPYVGIGRGGLPRCGYFSGASPASWPYQPAYFGQPDAPGYASPGMAKQQELDHLKSQAEAIKRQLDQIESRMRDLESEGEGESQKPKDAYKNGENEGGAMRVAISATGPGLDAEAEPRFGRCQYFIFADPETMEFEVVDNSGAMAGGGAGISAAQMIAIKGAHAVLTGNCGPNAYQALSAAGIQVITGVSGKVKDAIEGYRSGRFKASTQPNVPDHFGMGATPGMGGGLRMGGGRGRGMFMGSGTGSSSGDATQQQSRDQELQALKTQSQSISQQLADIQSRIEALEKK